MIQTYPVDNLLFTLKSELEENSNLKQKFLNMEGISDIAEYLIRDNTTKQNIGGCLFVSLL